MSVAVGPTGEVLAIEALPTLAEELSRKLASNGGANVTVMATAVGTREGTSSFSWVQGGDGYSGLRKRPDLPGGMETTVTEIEVPTDHDFG